MSTLREPEAEGLMRAGMARVVGRGSRVRCIMLSAGVARRVALSFLHGNRYGSPSRTVTVERVGPKRQPVYQHLDRSFGFGTLENLPIVSRPHADPVPMGSAEVCTEEMQTEKGRTICPTHTCEQLPAVDNSCLQPENEIAVHPEERGLDAEKEGETVANTAESATAGLSVESVPAQPQLSTIPEPIPEDPSDMSGLRRLAAAVLVRAFEDARTDGTARRWFEVTPQPMLKFWCEVAELDPERFRQKALEAVKNGKVMTATT